MRIRPAQGGDIDVVRHAAGKHDAIPVDVLADLLQHHLAPVAALLPAAAP